MLLTIKRAIAKNIGKNLELCKDAFEEGRKQGRILVTAEKEKAKQKEESNKVAEPTPDTTKSNQYAYDRATQTSSTPA